MNVNEESVFAEALEVQDPGRRAALLDRLCAGNAELRHSVESLLAAYGAGQFLESPAPLATVQESTAAEGPGTVIGPYKLLEQIGEGGFGVVFMAEQTQPVRRKVALKVLKPGMDTRQVVARFEAERQALAIMDHPNIAKVLDGGSTEPIADFRLQNADCKSEISNLQSAISGGRPYFVMELVKGVPITEFCDQNHLTPRQRLELFIPVCQAVQHAHQKGIIHRDLKPSNVLVTVHDTTPVPKIIDFGIAKALGQELTDKTLFTGFAQMIGTPLYMSPEQAGQSGLDIDTRSDIYSLGVLLYELLTGTTPFDKERFKQAAYDEIRRIIREEDPPKPSTRLSDTWRVERTAQSAEREAPNGKGASRSTLRALRFYELDWIVMKALDKDRNRRYETANGFAMDLQRYLADEPVLACPPSAWYRFRKFARRNKSRLTVAGMAATFLLILSVGIAWVAWDSAARRISTTTQAQSALDDAERLQGAEKWFEALEVAKRVEALLADLPGSEELRRRLLDLCTDLNMVGKLDEIMLLQTETHAGESRFTMREALPVYASVFANYGIRVADKNGEEVGAWIRARRDAVRKRLVAALDDWIECARAQKLHSEVAWLRDVVRAADPDEFRYQVRAASALEDRQAARWALVEFANSKDLDRQPPQTLVLLGRALSSVEAWPSAAAVLRRAVYHYPGDFWTNQYLGLALLNVKPPQPGEATAFYTAAAALRPHSAGAHLNVGNALKANGDLAGATDRYSKAIELKSDYAVAWNNRGIAHAELKQFDKAIADFSKAIELKPEFANAWVNRGVAYVERKQFDKAIADYSQAIELKAAEAKPWYNRGLVHAKLKQFDKAIADFSKAIELKPEFADAWYDRGLVHAKLEQFDKAIADYSKAIELKPDMAEAWHNRGCLYGDLNQLDKAIADLSKGIELKQDSTDARMARGLVHLRLQQFDKAIADYSKAIEIKPDYSLAWKARGDAYGELKQYDKAIADYSKAIDIKKDNAKVWYCRGNAHNNLKQYDKAIADYAKAIEINKGFAEAWCNRGCAYRDLKQYDQAIADYSKAIELRPDLVNAWYGRGILHAKRKQFDQAIADYSKAIELKPDYAEAWTNRGVVYAERKQFDRTIADYSKAIELKPDLFEAWTNRASAHMALKQYDKAIADYSKAIETKEDCVVARNALAWLLATCPDPKFRDGGRAVQAAKRAVELAPAESSYWHTLGVAHYRAGNWKEAMTALEKCLDMQKWGTPHDWFFLAMAHWRLGKKDEARKWYDHAVQWMEKRADRDTERLRFRAEAEELMGIKKQ